MLKFLHCADIHIDMPFASLGSGTDKSSIRRQDLKETFKKVIELARLENVDLLLICGDLYEHGYVRKSSINFINDCFKSIPEVKVFIVPGNHDPNILNSYYQNYPWNENVFILTKDKPSVFLEDLGVCVYGAGFESFYEENHSFEYLKSINRSYINILLAHGTVDLNIQDSSGARSYNPLSSSELLRLGMDYIALGHFHNRIEEIGNGNIFNPGSPEPLGFDEGGEHGVFLCSLNKNPDNESKLEVKFTKLNKRFYVNLDISADGCNSTEKVIDVINTEIKYYDMMNALFNIRLKGFIEPGLHIDIPLILQSFGSHVFHMKLSDETSEAYDVDAFAKEAGLRGSFTRKILDKIANVADPHQIELLNRALSFGLQALEEGKVEVGR